MNSCGVHPAARVVRWPRATHYLFLTQERDVLDEFTKFLNTLAEISAQR